MNKQKSQQEAKFLFELLARSARRHKRGHRERAILKTRAGEIDLTHTLRFGFRPKGGQTNFCMIVSGERSMRKNSKRKGNRKIPAIIDVGIEE